MASDQSSEYPSSSSYLLPPVESLIGSFVSLISNYGLRYQGFLFHLDFHATLGLQNVMCYGTEERNNSGFQIPPSNDVYSYIVFRLSEIKNILFKPPMSFTRCSLPATGSTSSKLSHSAAKPPLPWTDDPHGAKTCQTVPLLSNEKLNKPQDTTQSDAFSINAPVFDLRLQIASNPLAQPQFPCSNFYDPWSNYVYQSMPYGTLYQTPIYAALPSNLLESFATDNQSFFTTFPPVPEFPPPISGRALNKNFKQYELWGPCENNNQRDQTYYTNDGSTAYTIDGSSYKISRNPFDPTENPCNPVGPIETCQA